MIGEEEVISFVSRFGKRFEKIEPSFFEWTAALAFDYFAGRKVDVAVIETGLGGRLDSTNIITPVLSVITNISYDHMQLLGDTLQKIAIEKAGIIKSNIPVVVGEKQKECDFIFTERAKELHADICFASEDFPAEIVAAHEPFDLSAAAPVRFTILQLAERRVVVLLAAHHIALDSWSMAVLGQEILCCSRL